VGYGIQILNNYIHDNGQTGIGGGIGVTTTQLTESINSGILIQGNLITHNDLRPLQSQLRLWRELRSAATSGVTIPRQYHPAQRGLRRSFR